MNRTHVMIVSAVSAVALTMAFAGLGTAQSLHHDDNAPVVIQAAANGAASGKGGWMARGGRYGGMRAICSDQRDARIAGAFDTVESFAAFNTAQTRAWEALKDSIRKASGDVGAACSDLKATDGPATAPERLARMERMMATGLAVVQGVRPKFDAFYNTLDEKQKAAIDRMTSRHGRL